MTEDPEQRIADLEQGLARPEPGPGTAAPTRAGLRLGWIVFALLVAALVVGGGLLLVGSAQNTVPGVPVAAEPPDPPTQSLLPTARPEPPVQPSTGAPVTPEIPVPPGGPPGGGALSVSGIDRNETIDCAGRTVTVSGVGNAVVLTGRCDRVDISGVRNSVRIDEAAEIIVSGLDNDVVYLSGNPRLDESGLRNRLSRG